eukprot:3323086-Rhodomonas_salina.2
MRNRQSEKGVDATCPRLTPPSLPDSQPALGLGSTTFHSTEPLAKYASLQPWVYVMTPGSFLMGIVPSSHCSTTRRPHARSHTRCGMSGKHDEE